MSTHLLSEPKVLMAQHLAVLRDYGQRVFSGGGMLAAEEEEDRLSRVAEFMAIGKSCRLTERELVALVYRGFFDRKLACECPTCRERAGGGDSSRGRSAPVG